MADVPLYVVSDYSSSERRITPAWSITQLKRKLEPITGIPPSCQRISLKTPSNEVIPIGAENEENVHLQNYPLTPYAELHVSRILISHKSFVLALFSLSLGCFEFAMNCGENSCAPLPRDIPLMSVIC